MEKKVLVKEQGDRIDLGIYLISIWDSVEYISRTYPNIIGPFLKIAQIFRKYDWDIRKYLNKRIEYKYFQEKDIEERKKEIEYLDWKRANAKTKEHYNNAEEYKQLIDAIYK